MRTDARIRMQGGVSASAPFTTAPDDLRVRGPLSRRHLLRLAEQASRGSRRSGARAGDQPLVCPDVVELPDSDKVLVQSAAPGVADRLATAFPRAVDRVERVAVCRVAVLELPRSSASADVLDGLGCWR